MNLEGVSLPEPIETIYEYQPATRHGEIIYLAGQIAKVSPDRLHAVGQCGEEVDFHTACRCAEIAAEQALSWAMKQLESEEAINRILRIDVYVAVAADFEGMSSVADAASRVFIQALGDRGRHARSVLGVTRLPRNAPVLIEMTAAAG